MLFYELIWFKSFKCLRCFYPITTFQQFDYLASPPTPLRRRAGRAIRSYAPSLCYGAYRCYPWLCAPDGRSGCAVLPYSVRKNL